MIEAQGQRDYWRDRALVAERRLAATAEALIDWRNTYLCPCSDIEESASRLLEATDAALSNAGVDPYAGSKPLVEITSPINPQPHGLQHD
jgi:hypothetical protein